MKKVGEVSRLAGVSKRTLQYYDDEGMIDVERSKDNYRLYDQESLKTLWEIMIYKEMGLNLKTIKQILRMKEGKQKEQLYWKIQQNRKEIQKLQQQNIFIMWVAEKGMPERFDEKCNKTYSEQITELKHVIGSRCNMSRIKDIKQLRKRLDEAYEQLQLRQLRYAIYDVRQVMKKAMKMIVQLVNGEEWDEEDLLINIRICEREQGLKMESGMIQRLHEVRCICECAKEALDTELNYNQVRFAIMQIKDLLNYVEEKITA